MKVRIKQLPKAAYGGQANFGLNRVPDWIGKSDSDSSTGSTLPEVPEHLANVNAEKNERVVGDFDGDGMAEMMNVNGKPHSQGGKNINVPVGNFSFAGMNNGIYYPKRAKLGLQINGSFIFSDTKAMKMTGPAMELFNKNPNKKYTPAEIAKNYDINKYKELLTNTTSDPFQKKTAEMMLNNYHTKLGQLALLQESKKGFPQGIPGIAADFLSGAKYSSGTTTMQKGGFVVHPGDRYENKYNKSRYTADELRTKARDLGYDGPEDTKSLQTWLQTNAPELVNKYHQEYGMPKGGKQVDGKWGYRWDAIIDNYKSSLPSLQTRETGMYPVDRTTPSFNAVPVQSFNFSRTPAPFRDTTPSGYLAPDKAAMFNSLYNLASIKKYLPWEAPVQSVVPSPTYYDPTRELAQNSGQAYQNMLANNLLAGPNGRSRNSAIQGQAAENAGNIIGKYADMNVGLANQFAGIEADITNNTLAQQRQRANSLFDKNTIANQQYDNARRQAIGDLTQTYATAWRNRQSNNAVNQTSQYYYSDPNTGKIVFKSDAAKSAFLDNLRSGDQTQLGQLFQQYKKATEGMTPEDRQDYINFLKAMSGK